MSMPLRRGVHPLLEAEADRLLKESLAGVTKHSAKSDILTPWKEQDRRRREVYPNSGVPERHVRQGLYHRAANPARPELNSRDGVARSERAFSGLQAFVAEHGPADAFDE